MKEVVHAVHLRPARRTALDASRLEPQAVGTVAAVAAGAERDHEGLDQVGPQRGERRPYAEDRAPGGPRQAQELTEQALFRFPLGAALDVERRVQDLPIG